MDDSQLNDYFSHFIDFSVMSAIAVALLVLTSCASVAPLPDSGPQQKTAGIVVNPSCGFMCFGESNQSTALEDIQNNTAPVVGGAQAQANTQGATGSLAPTITVDKAEKKAKDD